ncbi:MAG: 5-formyltetrahydrofolate cyclo-ligase [bacterium]
MKKDSKAAIRKLFISKRDNLSSAERQGKSLLIANRLLNLDEFRKAKICLLYASFRSEVITEHLIPLILKEEKRLAFPIIDQKSNGLLLSEIKNGIEDLIPSTYGIKEPLPEKARLISVDEIDLFLIPGVAFDLSGTRLGFGGGYYDRLLAKIQKKPILALAYDIQITSNLPCGPFDIKMKKIITESRVIDCEIKTAVLTDFKLD